MYRLSLTFSQYKIDKYCHFSYMYQSQLYLHVLLCYSMCACPLQVAACHQLQHPFILELLKKLTEGSYPMLEVSVQVQSVTLYKCKQSKPYKYL